jgi:rfaE bifunctional protein kinase chain/domain
VPASLLDRLTKANVLIVGDAMLDRYWYGDVDRISPEAPVPVVHLRHTDERPGGAANVARNVRALGAACTLISITGDDPEAARLAELLAKENIGCHLQRDKLLNTIVKLRVISRHQQLLRVDFEAPPSKDARVQLLDEYLRRLAGFSAVIVSDYGKGGLGYIQEMIQAARKAGVPVIVDPKGQDYSHYRGATLLTPNRREFEQVAGRFTDNEDLKRKAGAMIAALDLGGLLVTRGEEGMSYFGKDGVSLHVPARARDVFDVTGAGDTVIAAVGASLAVAGALPDALQLANIAAGIVVSKLGAATATPDEIRRELKVGNP